MFKRTLEDAEKFFFGVKKRPAGKGRGQYAEQQIPVTSMSAQGFVQKANTVGLFSGAQFYTESGVSILGNPSRRSKGVFVVTNAIHKRIESVTSSGRTPTEEDLMFHYANVDENGSVVLYYSSVLYNSVIWIRTHVLATSYKDLVKPGDVIDPSLVINRFHSIASNPFGIVKGNVAIEKPGDVPTQRVSNHLFFPANPDVPVAIIKRLFTLRGLGMAMISMQLGGANNICPEFIHRAITWFTRKDGSSEGIEYPFSGKRDDSVRFKNVAELKRELEEERLKSYISGSEAGSRGEGDSEMEAEGGFSRTSALGYAAGGESASGGVIVRRQKHGGASVLQSLPAFGATDTELERSDEKSRNALRHKFSPQDPRFVTTTKERHLLHIDHRRVAEYMTGMGEKSILDFEHNIREYRRYVSEKYGKKGAGGGSSLEIEPMAYSGAVKFTASDIYRRSERINGGKHAGVMQSIAYARSRHAMSVEEELFRSRNMSSSIINHSHVPRVAAYIRKIVDMNRRAGIRAFVCEDDDRIYSGTLRDWEVTHILSGVYSGWVFGKQLDPSSPDIPAAVVYSSDGKFHVAYCKDRLSCDSSRQETFRVGYHPEGSDALDLIQDPLVGARAKWYYWNGTKFRTLHALVRSIIISRLDTHEYRLFNFSSVAKIRVTSRLPEYRDDLNHLYWGYMSHDDAVSKLAEQGSSPGSFFLYQNNLAVWLALTMKDEDGGIPGYGVIHVTVPLTESVSDQYYTLPKELADERSLGSEALESFRRCSKIAELMNASPLITRGISNPHARVLSTIPFPRDPAYKAWWGKISRSSAKGILRHSLSSAVAMVRGTIERLEKLHMQRAGGRKEGGVQAHVRSLPFCPFHLFFSEGKSVKCMYILHDPECQEEYVSEIPVSYHVVDVSRDGIHFVPWAGKVAHSLDDFQQIVDFTSPIYEVRRHHSFPPSKVEGLNVDPFMGNITTFRIMVESDVLTSQGEMPQEAIARQIEDREIIKSRFSAEVVQQHIAVSHPYTVAAEFLSKGADLSYLRDAQSSIPNTYRLAPTQASDLAQVSYDTAVHFIAKNGAEIVLSANRDLLVSHRKNAKSIEYEMRMSSRRINLHSMGEYSLSDWYWGASGREAFLSVKKEMQEVYEQSAKDTQRTIATYGEVTRDEIRETREASDVVGGDSDAVSSYFAARNSKTSSISRRVSRVRVARNGYSRFVHAPSSGRAPLYGYDLGEQESPQPHEDEGEEEEEEEEEEEDGEGDGDGEGEEEEEEEAEYGTGPAVVRRESGDRPRWTSEDATYVTRGGSSGEGAAVVRGETAPIPTKEAPMPTKADPMPTKADPMPTKAQLRASFRRQPELPEGRDDTVLWRDRTSAPSRIRSLRDVL